MVYLLFTADYEIFGNGTGDVRCCVINPTNQLLDLCDRYGAKLTLFFEVCEYWAFKAAKAQGKLEHLDYDPAMEMANQAQDAVRRGHDVQLHIHPQWLNAEIRDGVWQVDLSLWRIPSLSKSQLLDVFQRGKMTLEEMLRSVDASYRCLAFRAGALGIQPEQSVLQAIRIAGLSVDSSVVPGMQMNDGFAVFDFRDTPRKPVYRISQSVTAEDPHGDLWELPTNTKMFSIWERDLRAKIRRKWKHPPRNPNGCSGSVPNRRMGKESERIWNRLKPRLFTLDISSPARVISRFVKSAINESDGQLTYPLVAGGHPKTFGDSFELERFLRQSRKLTKQGLFQYATISELSSALNANTG